MVWLFNKENMRENTSFRDILWDLQAEQQNKVVFRDRTG